MVGGESASGDGSDGKLIRISQVFQSLSYARTNGNYNEYLTNK